ncbi:MAG: lysophospholipase [Clostridia bacterium]|nr:lysophospholipase [Clostridia bacterium]
MNESQVIFEELTYPSADGKTRVHGYIWRPDGVEPRAMIQLSHGMCEYVQRYDGWARRFCALGFVFCGNDHLGHGHTAPDEAHLGFTAPREGAFYLVEDLHTMSVLMRQRFPELPLILYGHSMGSFAARAYLTRYGELLTGALISGTAGAGQPTGVAKRLAHAIAAAKGDLHRSKFLTSLAFGAYNKRFREEKDEFSWLTRDKAVRDAYRDDRFCTFVFTAAGYDTLFTLLNTVSKKNWAADVPKKLPILLFAGEEDPVGDYGKGVRQVYDRLVAAGCEQVSLKLYPEGRHEMHNECNRDKVFADLTAFLEDVLK